MKYLAFFIGIIAVVAGYFGYQYTQSTEMAVGAPFSQFISTQLAGSPVAGYVLSTNGSVNSWIPAAGGGSSKWTDAGSVIYPAGGESVTVSSISATGTATSTFTRLSVSTALNLFGTIGTALSDFCVAITGGAGLCDGNDATGGGGSGSNWTIVSGGLQTSTSTDFVRASNFIATSTTATSTFPNTKLVHIQANTSAGIDIDSFNNTDIANFGVGSSANSLFYGGVNINGSTRLATSLNGVLQATAGAVTATTTGTLTESVNGLQFDNTRALIGGSAALSLTSGFAIPSTTDYTGWNLASSSRHAAVTLSGALDYITLVGQDIVRGAIDLATDVTGFLGITNGGTGTSTAPTTDQILVGRAGGTYDYRRITAGSNVTVSTSTAGQIQISSTASGGSSATGTTLVCASGCPYTSIQTALNDGINNIQLKEETYAGPISITESDTRIRGAGLYTSLITCAAGASTACVKVATSSNLSRITLEHFGIDNTLGTSLGIGLDTSNTSNVYVNNVRITEFNLGHLHQDTNDQTFYSVFTNMVYFDNSNCFATGGTRSNDNVLYSPRCRVATSTGIGYNFKDAQGWLLSSPNSEPGSAIGTAFYADATTLNITVTNPWFEGNATGTELASGSKNINFIGGVITVNTVGLFDAGLRNQFNGTLISDNTTDFSGSPLNTMFVNSFNGENSSNILIGTTTRRSAQTLIGLGISSSDPSVNMIDLNNYGAFATAPVGIGFNNTAGGFGTGVARLFSNPGSGFANANFNIGVADSSRVLQTRLTVDVDGDLGIGTTTPGSKLSVIGGGQFTSLVSCNTIDTDANGILSCGTDATGGSGVLSTSTPWVAGQLAYVRDGSTISSVATGTLSTTATGLSLSNNPAIIGANSVLSLDAGRVIPLSASTTEWSTAYASTTNLTPTFIRSLFSNTATGLTYTAGTGLTALTAGFNIPLTASTTEWSGFYNTPSTRITAGSGLSWTGNTLSATGGAGGSNWTLMSGGLRTSTSTDFARAAYFVATSTTATSTFAGPVGVGTTTLNANTLFAVGTSTWTGFHVGTNRKVGIGCVNNTPGLGSFGCGSNANLNPNINFVIQDPTDARFGATVNNQGVFIKSSGGLYAYDYTLAAARSLELNEFGGNVSIGSTTPGSIFTIQGKAATPATTLFSVASSTGANLFSVLANGNVRTNLANCNTIDSDANGILTCGTDESGGGGGGGALSTTTDVIGSPATPELVSYVTGDVMFGGSASTSAEFQFDDDAGQFIISSTSNSNATATIESSNAAQAVRIGDDSGVGMENIFRTVGKMISRFYGAIVQWIIDIPDIAMTGNLFITSSSTSYFNATTTDSLVIDGFTNSGEWIKEFCTTPTGETTQVVADTLRGCNRYAYSEDGAGALDFVVPTTGTSTYFNLQPGATGAANAAGDGMGINWASGLDFGDIQRHQPAMEFAIRQDTMANATGTFIQAGITSAITINPDFAAEPAQGFYVLATSTQANFLLACNPATGNTTYVDTGIASSTTATASANPFVHFRLEVGGTVNTAVTAILKARTTTNRNMTEVGSCTQNNSASTQAVSPVVGIGKSGAGTSSDLHLMFLKFWHKQPVF